MVKGLSFGIPDATGTSFGGLRWWSWFCGSRGAACGVWRGSSSSWTRRHVSSTVIHQVQPHMPICLHMMMWLGCWTFMFYKECIHPDCHQWTQFLHCSKEGQLIQHCHGFSGGYIWKMNPKSCGKSDAAVFWGVLLDSEQCIAVWGCCIAGICYQSCWVSWLMISLLSGYLGESTGGGWGGCMHLDATPRTTLRYLFIIAATVRGWDIRQMDGWNKRSATMKCWISWMWSRWASAICICWRCTLMLYPSFPLFLSSKDKGRKVFF